MARFEIGYGEEYEGDGFTDQVAEEFGEQEACLRATQYVGEFPYRNRDVHGAALESIA